jgi:hypothetical protein
MLRAAPVALPVPLPLRWHEQGARDTAPAKRSSLAACVKLLLLSQDGCQPSSGGVSRSHGALLSSTYAAVLREWRAMNLDTRGRVLWGDIAAVRR